MSINNKNIVKRKILSAVNLKLSHKSEPLPAMSAGLGIAPPGLQLYHPNRYIRSEDEETLIENTEREQGSLKAVELVRWIADKRAARAAARAAHVVPALAVHAALHRAQVVDILSSTTNPNPAVLDADHLALKRNPIRYCVRMLKLHIDWAFDISPKQTTLMLHMQLLDVVIGAVEATTRGRLLPAVRMWDFDISKMEFWSPRAQLLTQPQRLLCFRIVHRYASVNYSTTGLVKDVATYAPTAENLALFAGCEFTFATSLREVLSSFGQSSLILNRTASRAERLERNDDGDGGGDGNGGGGGGGGSSAGRFSTLRFSARMEWELTSQVWKHVEDARLWSHDEEQRGAFFDCCEAEGVRIVDRAKLHVLPEDLRAALAPVYLEVCQEFCTADDVNSTHRSAVVQSVYEQHCTTFVSAVLRRAPFNLILKREKGGKKRTRTTIQTTEKMVQHIFIEVLLSLTNLRRKVVRKLAPLSSSSTALAQGFRQTIAVRAATTTAEHMARICASVKALEGKQ